MYKDVDRTDRELAFYDQGSPNLAKLNNILMTYTQYNFDLGESVCAQVSKERKKKKEMRERTRERARERAREGEVRAQERRREEDRV